MTFNATHMAQSCATYLTGLPLQLKVIGLSVVLVVFAWILLRCQRWWWQFTYESAEARRARKAVEAEHDAEILLRKHGYRIVSSQTEHVWPIYLNGQTHEVTMRADFIVSRRGKRYIAEVKSGKMAPSINTAATRRQLLEYRLAYPVDGILLVDMESVDIYEVMFEFEHNAKYAQPLKWMATGVVVGVMGLWALLRM